MSNVHFTQKNVTFPPSISDNSTHRRPLYVNFSCQIATRIIKNYWRNSGGTLRQKETKSEKREKMREKEREERLRKKKKEREREKREKERKMEKRRKKGKEKR